MSPAMWASAPRRSLRAEHLAADFTQRAEAISARAETLVNDIAAGRADVGGFTQSGRITSGVTSRFDESRDLTQKMERIPIWARSPRARRVAWIPPRLSWKRRLPALVTLASVRDGIKGLDVWREYRSRAEGDGKPARPRQNRRRKSVMIEETPGSSSGETVEVIVAGHPSPRLPPGAVAPWRGRTGVLERAPGILQREPVACLS